MHDMPIHSGYEIEESLVESEESIIYQQAENRMHVEKALLVCLLNQRSAQPVFSCDYFVCPEHATEEMDKKYMGHYGT